MTLFLWFIGVFVFITLLAISIALHEAGHMIAAKKLGLSVPSFFVGFGKTLYSKTIKGTEYGIKVLPLGGFVKIQDPNIHDEKDSRKELLSHVKPWKRQIVFSAGPLVNIVLGFSILTLLFMTQPIIEKTNIVETVPECSQETVFCGASQAGVQPGDEIIAINNTSTSEKGISALIPSDAKTVLATIIRDSKELTLEVPVQNQLLGVTVNLSERPRTFVESIKQTNTITWETLLTIPEIPNRLSNNLDIISTGERADETLTGMVSIANIYGEVASTETINMENKVKQLVYFTGVFNIGLGVINLIPIVPLDGGRMLIAFFDSCKGLWSKITRRKYNPTGLKFFNVFGTAGALVVFGFMFIIILTDIISPASILS